MKYWWLEKYKNFNSNQRDDLMIDIEYFVTIPKQSISWYEQIKNRDLSLLEEEDLLVLLYYLVHEKAINQKLNQMISKLLTYPDNSFPASDYNLEEMLVEIKNLYKNLPINTKLEHNNIAICYHCLNIFYIDKIKKVNKLNLCLCPYCNSNKLYFDNDYIPMNYTFLKLTHLYYHVSNLGCSFIELQKIVKQNIKITADNMEKVDVDFTKIFSEKLTPIYEKQLMKMIYDELRKQDQKLNRKVIISIEEIENGIPNKILLLLISLMEVLSSTVYLKEIMIKTNSKKIETYLRSLLKTMMTFPN